MLPAPIGHSVPGGPAAHPRFQEPKGIRAERAAQAFRLPPALEFPCRQSLLHHERHAPLCCQSPGRSAPVIRLAAYSPFAERPPISCVRPALLPSPPACRPKTAQLHALPQPLSPPPRFSALSRPTFSANQAPPACLCRSNPVPRLPSCFANRRTNRCYERCPLKHNSPSPESDRTCGYDNGHSSRSTPTPTG